MTPAEFIASTPRFRPGTYEVMLIHPCTKCPVKVCFSLPVCPKKVLIRGVGPALAL